eukprot:GEMP01117266.1.p1 GENE.GEMP01117266.1~~GEMP01117266.1.p1  ORF type:complete len:153 (+),score=16.85 GEMP01117266.1:46-459(+)
MNWVSYLDFEKLEKGTEISKIMELEIDVDSTKFVCGKNQQYSCVTDLFSFFGLDCLLQFQQEAVAAQQKEYSISSRMLKRVQPLTTDEIDCLIEYSKDQMIERHFAGEFPKCVARHDQLRPEAIQQAKEAERTAEEP